MIRPPPSSPRTYILFPYSTFFRSCRRLVFADPQSRADSGRALQVRTRSRSAPAARRRSARQPGRLYRHRLPLLESVDPRGWPETRSPPQSGTVTLNFFQGLSCGQRWRRLWRNVDRKSVGSGKSVSVLLDLGGRRIISTKTNNNQL